MSKRPSERRHARPFKYDWSPLGSVTPSRVFAANAQGPRASGDLVTLASAGKTL